MSRKLTRLGIGILAMLLLCACNRGSTGKGTGGAAQGGAAGSGKTIKREDYFKAFQLIQPAPELQPFMESEAHLFALSPPSGEFERGWAEVLSIAADDEQAAIALLESGRVDPASEALPGFGLLRLSVMFGKAELCRYLLEQHAAADVMTQADMNELLTTAIGHGDAEMIELLAGNGARISMSAGYLFRNLGIGNEPDPDLLAFVLEQDVISDTAQDWCAVLANTLPQMDAEQLADQIERCRELRGTEAMNDADLRYAGNRQTYDLVKGCMDDSHKLELLLADGLDLEEVRYTDQGELFGKLLKEREKIYNSSNETDWGDVVGLFKLLDERGISLDSLPDDWSLVADVGFLRQPPPAELIELLAEHGVDPNRLDSRGQTILLGLLHYQEEEKYTAQLARDFVAAGLDPLLEGDDGFSAVHFALVNGDIELARELLGEREPDLATLAVLGTVEQFKQAAGEQVIVNRGLEIKRGLHLAAGADHERFRELYDSGFVPDLCSLVINGDAELLRDALARENYTEDGETFGYLFYQEQFDENDDMLKALLDSETYMARADMDYFAYTMFRSVSERKPQRLRIMLEAGIPVAPEDEMMRRGTPLLCMAVSFRDEEMIKLLFEFGADPNVGLVLDPATGTLTGDPPIMHLKGTPEVLDYDLNRRIYKRLLDEGARLDFLATSMMGQAPQPPLWDLCRTLDADTLHLLLDHGLDPGQMPPPPAAGKQSTTAGLPPGVTGQFIVASSLFNQVLTNLSTIEGMDPDLFSQFARHALDDDLKAAMRNCIMSGNTEFLPELLAWLDAPLSDADQKLLMAECFAAGDLEALDLLLNRDFALPDYNTALNQMLQRLR
ncbi:hypothetical protein KDL29_12520 [bacterium]|nr:hypothetical protein [bacterium]UNM09103.1 MAG: hypothetical protein H7A35_03415 [Planctomycetales bacterium]